MKLPLSWLLAAGIASAQAPAGGCQTLTGEHIYASDLAKAAPVFATLNPEIEIGLAPLPGMTRVFHAIDLLRIARNNGLAISGTPAQICFERTGATARTAGVMPQVSTQLAPLAVKRGEKVAVTVISGAVVLHFESEAESSGRPGDSVLVLNPENGNRFPARVEDQGKVVVEK